jgi:hypothetical protein
LRRNNELVEARGGTLAPAESGAGKDGDTRRHGPRHTRSLSTELAFRNEVELRADYGLLEKGGRAQKREIVTKYLQNTIIWAVSSVGRAPALASVLCGPLDRQRASGSSAESLRGREVLRRIRTERVGWAYTKALDKRFETVNP